MTIPADTLDDLLHAPCPPPVRQQIADVLRDCAAYRDRHRDGSTAQITRLAAALPGAAQLLADPGQAGILQTHTAVADPPLYMSTLLHHILVAGSLTLLATPDQAAPHLEALDSGRAKGVYLITEAGHAGSHLNPRTRAVHDPATGDFTLTTPDADAAKFSSVSPRGGRALGIVFAQLHCGGAAQGVYPFVVPLTTDDGPAPGVDISGPLASAALPVPYALIRFTGARVPHANWLAPGVTLTGTTLQDPLPRPQDRLIRALAAGPGMYGTIPAALAAVSRTSATAALRFARSRTTHNALAPGAPLLHHRTHQIALYGALAEAFALTCTARHAHALWAQPSDRRSATDTTMTFAPWSAMAPELAVCKAAVCEGAVRVTAACQRHCGLHGLLEPNRIDAWHGLARAFATAGGDNHLILLEAGRTLAHTPPDDTPPDAPLPVTDPGWWPATARLQQARQAHALHQRLTDTPADTADIADQGNHLLPQTAALGHAHADVTTADALHRAISRLPDGQLPFLRPLAALYGVRQAQLRLGALLAHHTLAPAQAHALDEAAATLCWHLHPHLDDLLRLDGFPADLTATALAAPDYAGRLAEALARNGESA
ncbi:acyl-CoA dehydrogenase [Streptomyces sp. NPDC057654]|uniref:acyl-CoA dehydrogenase family protein n=1 Tax=Streptomyces sp. NPDC057654 TaxID=3346196 RepID=UPI0036D12097